MRAHQLFAWLVLVSLPELPDFHLVVISTAEQSLRRQGVLFVITRLREHRGLCRRAPAEAVHSISMGWEAKVCPLAFLCGFSENVDSAFCCTSGQDEPVLPGRPLDAVD